MTKPTRMESFRFFYLLIIFVNIALTSAFQYSDDDKVIPYSTIRMRRRLYAKRRHRNICNPENDDRNNEKLREVIRNSDFVFTGKVASYYVERETNSIRQFRKRESGRREKRRRFKKPKTSKTTTTTLKPDEVNSIDVNFDIRKEKSETFVVELKRVIKGGAELSGVDQTVVRVPKEFVSGLEITSDPTLNTNCVEFHPVLKLRSTAILITKKLNGTALLELTYFPVAMTLRHLDRVDGAVEGIRGPFFISLKGSGFDRMGCGGGRGRRVEHRPQGAVTGV